MNGTTRLLVWCVCFSVLLLAVPAYAQEEESSESGWEHSAIIYLLAPTIDGRVGIGGAGGDITIDPETVLDTIDMGFLGGWTMEKDRKWGLQFDLIYMDLSQDFSVRDDRIPGEVGNKQTIFNVNYLYRVSDNVQVLAGLMYTDISMKLAFEGPVMPRRFDAGDSWVDPVGGLRFATDLGERWSFAGFGYVGGFGVGSELVWSVNGTFNFQMTEHTDLALGYRYINYDYESGDRAQPGYFRFDVSEYGPALGVRWNF